MNEGSVQFATEEGLKHIYTPASWSNKIKFIEHLITGNNVLVSILGEDGGGKTTFTRLLQANLSSQINVHLLKIAPLFDRNSLMDRIGSLLNCKGMSTLKSLVELAQSKKKHMLVILDDAHYLPDEFLQELLQNLKQQGDKAYFHVCLASNLSVVTKLNKLAQNEEYKEMIHSIELAPLSEAEAKIYIMHRLLLQSNSFNNEHLEQFYQLTNGDIVGINSQMNSFFRLVKEDKKPTTRRPLQQTMIAAGVGLAAWGVTFMLQMHSPTGALEATEYTAQLSPHSQKVSLPKSVAEVDKLVSTVEAKEENEIVDKAVIAMNSAIPTYHEQTKDEHVNSQTPVQLAQTMDEDEFTDDTMLVIENLDSYPEEDELIQLDRASEMQAKIVEKISQEIAHVHTEKQLDSSPGKSRSGANSKRIVKVKSDESNHHTYTIQLLASHSKKALEQFAHAHHLAGKTQIRLSKRNGTPWYVLTIGEYKQRDLAKKAAYSLPKDVTKSKPWVRPLSDLKQLG